jgi:hypothetical protein
MNLVRVVDFCTFFTINQYVILKCSFLTNGELWLTTLFKTATLKATDE